MLTIELDASPWRAENDIYNALLPALGAPHWHGHSLDAMIDSVIWGGINAVEPPYAIHIRGVAKASVGVQEKLKMIKHFFDESKREFRAAQNRDVGVELEILP